MADIKIDKSEIRDKKIVQTSIIGIIVNLLLVVFKAFVGLMSNSVAIILDAVNNLSDALSSVITIIGMKLASRPPDKKHPFGHGRMEYISALIISFIVLFAGITALIESVKKIINPETADYSTVTLIIVGVAVIVKIILGLYVKKAGEKHNSDSLVASGADAQFDSLISLATLIAAGIYIKWEISIEAWLAAAIAVFIIKAGIELIGDTVSKILGKRVDSTFSNQIKKDICEHKNVLGAYDLALHNYGPEIMIGSVHVEVYDYLTATEISRMIKSVQADIFERYKIFLTIGIYSKNTLDDEIMEMESKVREIALSNEDVLKMHAFFVEKEKKFMTFDVVINFGAKERHDVKEELLEELYKIFPGYIIQIQMDIDLSD